MDSKLRTNPRNLLLPGTETAGFCEWADGEQAAIQAKVAEARQHNARAEREVHAPWR